MSDELAEAIAVLARTRTAAQVFDAEGRLAWVSDDLFRPAGAEPGTDVGLGTLTGDGDRPIWHTTLTQDSLGALVDELKRRVDPSTEWAPAWVGPVRMQFSGRRLAIGLLGMTLRARDGSVLGSALLYAPLLPARVLALLVEGDESSFERLAALTEARAAGGRRVVRRHRLLRGAVPADADVRLLRADPGRADRVRRPGRRARRDHRQARRGRSAFFLQERHGSESATALAALDTARRLPEAVREHLARLADCGYDIDAQDCRMNVGVRWGANLYIGQVITGGGLEVTALGDEVTECARIEHVAAGGQTLVSKAVVERLDDTAAAGLGLSPKRLRYRVLADLIAGRPADPKALRDAGGIAVADLSEWPEPDAAGSAPCP